MIVRVSFQLVILLIFMSFGAISWVSTKLREQAEIKRVRDEMHRRQEEALRSTNVMRSAEAQAKLQEGAKTPMQLRMEELAARRQAQLRELRARQAQQQAGRDESQRDGTPVPLGRRLQPMPGTLPGGASARQPSVPSRPVRGGSQGGSRVTPVASPGSVRGGVVPMPADQGGQGRRGRSGQSAGQPGRVRSAEAGDVSAQLARAESLIESSAISDRTSGAAVRSKAVPAGVGSQVRALLGVTGPNRRAQQRALLAAAEVLSTPVALRQESELPWNRSTL